MVKEVLQWMAEDGILFNSMEEAEEHDLYVQRIGLVEEQLGVDFDTAVDIMGFIEKYAYWKE